MAWALGLPVVAKWSRPWPPAGSGLRSTSIVRSLPRSARCTPVRPRPAAGCCSSGFCRRAAIWTGSSTGTPTPPAAVSPGPPGARSGRGRTGRGSRRSAAGRRTPRSSGRRASCSPRSATGRVRPGLPARPGHRRVPPARFQPEARRAVPALRRSRRARRRPRDASGPDRPSGPGALPAYGRRFVVENYAALSVLTSPGRRRTEGPRGRGGGGTETAWFAADDLAPALAMAGAWLLHVLRKGVVTLRRLLLPGRPQKVTAVSPPPAARAASDRMTRR